MTNALARSLSPYLLQHQENPVNWVEWGSGAFETAQERDVPLFLSVGYAACHWCHVMAHESFENDEVGAFLNEHFVCIKVDREERPDIDQIYMNAVQLMTGHGGWPMSVFLDHHGRPFYSGTYWPVLPRNGMPSFPQVLDALVNAWANRRNEIHSHAGEITQALQELAVGRGSLDEKAGKEVPGADRVGVAVEGILKSFDPTWGGFGSAPKFPHATDLDLLLRVGVRTSDTRLIHAAEFTLDRMAAGGIRDHIGGGFARYSVDGHWLVPHFEKMLYDNGLLAEVYTRAYQVTGNQRHADVAAEILTYLQRDMIDAGVQGNTGGGIHCSEDADSGGVEGKFYVWKPDQVIAILGHDRGTRFCTVYNITEAGNFEGDSIPNLPRDLSELATELNIAIRTLQSELADDRERLRTHREQRVKPGRDDKIVVAWNALAIRAFVIAGTVLERDDFVNTGARASRFILDQMRDQDEKLLHVYRDGSSRLSAFVDDYALFADSLIALYEATGDESWLSESVKLGQTIVADFFDSDAGAFFYTANGSEKLITRNKDWHDGSLVSGNAAAAMVLLKLSRLTNCDWNSQVERTLQAGQTVIRKQSRACSALIAVLDELHYHQGELVIAVADANDVPAIATKVLSEYQPATTVAWSINAGSDSPVVKDQLLEGKRSIDGEAVIYRCRDYQCGSPEVIRK